MEDKINQFLSLPIEEKIRLINEGIKPETPFFLERIITAIESGNMNALCFMPKYVIDCYHEIKNEILLKNK